MFGPWGNDDRADSIRIIHRALNAGINFIDIADVYSAGVSEDLVGEALQGRLDDVVLAMKFSMPVSEDPHSRGGSRRCLRTPPPSNTAAQQEALSVEYPVIMTTRVPDGTPAETVDDIRTPEAARSRELASRGHVLRLWRPPLQPGEWRSLGLFAAADQDELDRVLALIPVHVCRESAGPSRVGPAGPVGAPRPPRTRVCKH